MNDTIKENVFEIPYLIEKDIENETKSLAIGNQASTGQSAAIKSNEKTFLCHVCSKSFLLKHHLMLHLKIHSNEKSFKCDICSKLFRQRSHLNQHKKFHTGDKKFICTYCTKPFMQNGDLKRHLKTHRSELPFHCTFCTERFPADVERQLHEQVCTKRRYKCTVCDFETLEMSALDVHKDTHNGERRFKCDICPKAFRLKHHLTVHLKTHATTKDCKKFQCHICNKRFSVKSNLSIHIKYHNGVKDFGCHACAKKFVHRGDLNRHLKIHEKFTKHTQTPTLENISEVIVKEEPTFQTYFEYDEFEDNSLDCNSPPQMVKIEDVEIENKFIKIEGEEVENYESLNEISMPNELIDTEPISNERPAEDTEQTVQNKIEFHSNNATVKKYQGYVNTVPSKDESNDKFISPKSQIKAKAKANPNPNPNPKPKPNQINNFICDICSKGFRLKHHLAVHLKIHSGQKNYQCEICSKCFKQSSHLNLHQKVHTGEKNIVCPYCEKRFIHRGDLNRHFKTHREQLPFACGSCGRRFFDEISKQTHENQCTIELLKCSMCDYITSVSSRFKTHMLSHSARNFQCEICSKDFIYKQNLENHLKIHSNERAFECSHCDSAFRLKAHLQRHLKKLHQI